MKPITFFHLYALWGISAHNTRGSYQMKWDWVAVGGSWMWLLVSVALAVGMMRMVWRVAFPPPQSDEPAVMKHATVKTTTLGPEIVITDANVNVVRKYKEIL